MRIGDSQDLGRYVRECRNRLGMTQAQLAGAARVSRRWLSDLESGKESADFGLVLRTLRALGQVVNVIPESETAAIDLDEVLAQYRRRDASDEPPVRRSPTDRGGTVTNARRKHLAVLIGRDRVGTVSEERGSLTFAYDESYRTNPGATPLSLSMPLSVASHADPVVRAFLWGLLRDNERVLEHAKNYSVLLSGAQVRLAPMYDVASALPYDGLHQPKLRMAMRIGGEYRVAGIGRRHWVRFAGSCRLDPDEVVARVGATAERVGDAFADVAHSDSIKALGSDLPTRLLDRIGRHADACVRALSGSMS
ncbi:MAG TPA: HipA N-terminal domain-containing protein [Micromonosporaceae bacterium]